MNKLLVAFSLVLLLSIPIGVCFAADESAGAAAADRNLNQASGSSARDKRSTNSEKSDRGYKDEEIGNAPPPPNRVRVRPTPR